MSSIIVATPAPTQLPTIYRAGDIILRNPQQTCVIFVAVILFSAFLEYFLQRVSNVENKYARVLVTTMSQEITIVGVLALFLMFSISVIPKEYMKPLFVQLFSWANISLFFLAVMFVFVIVVQFGWAALETRYVWKAFEEGALETEELEKLKYPFRIFKQLHELYRQELLAKSGLPTAAVPFNEYTALLWRRSLVRVSNLSFRTWTFLSVVIIINLVRIMFIPWKDGASGSERDFLNQLTLISILGWGMFLSYVVFMALLQSRLSNLAAGKIILKKDEPAFGLIPLGTHKRAIEFIQVLIFSYNWYIVLFITGGYKQVGGLPLGWQRALLMLMFFLPMLIFMITFPWCFHSMAMLEVIGNVNAKIVLGIFRRIRGEGEEGEDDDDDDDEDGLDEAEATLAVIARQLRLGAGQSSDKGSMSKGSKASKAPAPRAIVSADDGGAGGLRMGQLSGTKDASSGGADKDRPAWAEDDDDWDGNATLAYGERRNLTERSKAGSMFVNNVDADRVRAELRRMGAIAPSPAEIAKAEAIVRAEAAAAAKAEAAAAAAAAASKSKVAPKGKGKAAAAAKAPPKLTPKQAAAAAVAAAALAARPKAPRRPQFLDSDEDWDEDEGLIPRRG